MPTIKQLPVASSVSATDVIPVSQGGTTRSLTVGGLLSSTQPALLLASGKLLGRGSATAGGPEALSVGSGLAVSAGLVSATGDDHTRLPVASTLGGSDEVVVNSGGAAKRVPAAALRGLFSAGAGVTIDATGSIATVAGTGAGPATSSTIGLVKPGAGMTVSGDGALSVAALNVGTTAGTVAAGDDPRIVGAQSAVQVSAAVRAGCRARRLPGRGCRRRGACRIGWVTG